MTSIIGWLAIDARKASSIYFASDSRISWPDSSNWDSGRKLFACQTHPDIFGFYGDALFPSQALSGFIDLADSGVLFSKETTARERHSLFCEVMKSVHSRRRTTRDRSFTLFHAARAGEAMQCEFFLWSLSYRADDRTWNHKNYNLPTDHSEIVFASGSGTSSVEKHLAAWRSSEAGGTSRAIFSAFCDSLSAREDLRSGGAPQLVGLYRIKNGRSFGIYFEGRPYVHGMTASKFAGRSAIEWRNELFEIVDPDSGNLATDAQVHRREVAR